MDNKSKVLEFLRIPRATFYYQSILEEKDKKLKVDIENVWVKHPGTAANDWPWNFKSTKNEFGE